MISYDLIVGRSYRIEQLTEHNLILCIGIFNGYEDNKTKWINCAYSFTDRNTNEIRMINEGKSILSFTFKYKPQRIIYEA